MQRSRLLLLGIVLIAVVAASAVVYFALQNNSPKTVFQVEPIAMPQWEIGLDKPSAYINISVKNNGNTNQTNVIVKLSGGFTNSTNQVPDQLFLVETRTIGAIAPGETATTTKIFNFGYYFFYRIEVSSSDGTNETFNQWVSWRSSDMPPPPS
jgi:hypothetical protein